MWWIWGPSNGYAIFFIVPPFTLWILWHGYFAEMRRKSDDRKWWQNMYVVEIPFRLLNTINLLTLVRWAVSQNPPPWGWASEASNVVPMEFSIFVVIKQCVVGYVILLLADVLLNIEFTRRFFGLEKRPNHTETGYVISLSLVFGIMFWVLDSVIGSVIFYPERSFIDMLALDIPSSVIYVRTFFILACLAGGLMFSKLLRKHYEIENKFKDLYSMVRLMSDNLPDLIWTKDVKNRFIFANKACCEILLNAKDTDEPIGKDDVYFAEREKASHPENPDYHTFGKTCTDSDLMVMESKKPIRGDEFGNLKGENIYLDVYKAPFLDDNNNMIGTVGCARIITKEKEMEKARIKAEENIRHLNSILKAIRNVNQLIVLETDRDILLQKACDNLVEARSYDGTWLGLLDNGDTFAVVKGSGIREDESHLSEYLFGGNHPPCISRMLAVNDVFMVVDKSLDCRNCPLNTICLGDEIAIISVKHANKLFGLLAVSIISGNGINEDEEQLLTEVAADIGLALYKMEVDESRKKTENELRESEGKLSQIIQGNSMPTFVIDIDHNITHWNKACENLTGASEGEILGSNKLWSLFYPEEKPLMSDLVVNEASVDDIARYYGGIYEDSALVDGAYEAEDFFPKLGKNGIWLFFTAAPLKNQQGKMMGAIQTFQDITGRKQAEEKLANYAEKLANSNEELKSLDAMKNDFLSNVSHELKTPLVSIKGFSEVIRDELHGPLNDQQKKAMDTVVRNCGRLGRLINSILYLTIKKAGRDTYTFVPVNMSAVISDTIIDISPQINSKELIIEQDIAPDLSLINGDLDKLTQILTNLIENATKFTHNGSKITVKAYNEDENIHITVSDNGIGIPNELISKLFDKFYQVDASTTRRYGGTGIGLHISKLIVEVHNGKIWAESDEGVETTFHVVLPK